MEWFKVKVKHCLYSGLTTRQKCAWIDLMALTAQLEKLPNIKQRRLVCGPKTLQTLDERLSNEGKTLDEVLSKVLEDVEKVQYERERLKAYRKEKSNKRTCTLTSTEQSRVDKIREDKRREDKIRLDKKERHTLFKKPTVEEIKEYCLERKNSIDPEEVFNHYEANGWIRGKTPVKDWKACVRTWETNRKEKDHGTHKGYRTNAERTVDAVRNIADKYGWEEASNEASKTINI